VILWSVLNVSMIFSAYLLNSKNYLVILPTMELNINILTQQILNLNFVDGANCMFMMAFLVLNIVWVRLENFSLHIGFVKHVLMVSMFVRNRLAFMCLVTKVTTFVGFANMNSIITHINCAKIFIAVKLILCDWFISLYDECG
jgi:hypothetical protein